MATILPEFDDNPEAGAIIGRLVAGYGGLEISLAHCVGWITGQREIALKVMFRAPGEVQRILMADALGRTKLPDAKQRTLFEQTIAGMHVCRKIRNQYAHANWVSDRRGLSFVNIEEIAVRHEDILLAALTQHTAAVPLLREQESYFVHIEDCLTFLNYEAQLGGGDIVQPASTRAEIKTRAAAS